MDQRPPARSQNQNRCGSQSSDSWGAFVTLQFQTMSFCDQQETLSPSCPAERLLDSRPTENREL